MEETGLFSRYMMNELLDELDISECFKGPGIASILGEALKKWDQVHQDPGVIPHLTILEPQ